ncbi:DNA topology modulation protein FlaR [Paenibacillus albiflavus]|uniref:DNA topology modulation protein FlaR n=1 Tax=Paenibacillus albiflavus TaxID=2545760 RepID=A0A4V2WP66_9BACL|nr:DNA topology modulation protein FlaR [Paenibacillus albiflavus]TCZ78232.1 DNA topology modulation protein FlaR [Paenibacillus albiflavus]
MNQILNKIHIIGSVGSGKSTLARTLSSRLNIPYYELDNVVWLRTPNGDVRNSQEVRDATLHTIITSDQWIVEGVHHQWVQASFEKAELIIYLDTPIWSRNYRILKRYVVERLGLKKGNYKQSLSMLKRMYQWNYQYDVRSKPEIMRLLQPFQEKLFILQDNRDIEHIGKMNVKEMNVQ